MRHGLRRLALSATLLLSAGCSQAAADGAARACDHESCPMPALPQVQAVLSVDGKPNQASGTRAPLVSGRLYAVTVALSIASGASPSQYTLAEASGSYGEGGGKLIGQRVLLHGDPGAVYGSTAAA
jgi:hypothetical protein